jgi:acetyl-CoA acetyltransferase
METVVISGVAMTPFAKPSAGKRYEAIALEALQGALKDAGIDYSDVQQAFVSYTMGDTAFGQRVLYQHGFTGIPIFNVSNSCASGSTALYLARQAVASGEAECVLALGFEQMNKTMELGFPDRTTPFDRHDEVVSQVMGHDTPSNTISWFAGAAKEYVDQYGIDPGVFAQIAVKARKHAANNPRAVFRELLTAEQILESRTIVSPLTKFQCSPPTSGAAAAIVCSERYAKKHGLDTRVRIREQALTTDMESVFNGGSMTKMVGYDMAVNAATAVYEASGVGPDDVDVIELHDCFTSNELVSYEVLQLAAPGEGEKLVHAGDNTYGGRWVVNPSGGLLAKGHPIGATGLAQCAELVWQLRGQAEARQVEGARMALQHNLGIGGACVITLYERIG